MNAVTIHLSFGFGGWSLIFEKTLILNFAPFYGLNITEGDAEQIRVELANHEFTSTMIDYEIDNQRYFVSVRNKLSKGTSEEYIDDVLKDFPKFGSDGCHNV